MPAQTVLEILVRLKDEATQAMKGVAGSLKEAESASRTFAVGLGAVGAAALVAGGYAVQQAKEAEYYQTRLAHILRTSRGATDAHIQALHDQADALERVGVVSSDVIAAAQGTFATFDLQAESIRNLIPGFLDMVVAEKGVNATTDDMISYANALASALQGNYGALTKRGFILDEETKKLIENGTEQEKVAAIVGVLNSTYKGMNETLRGTTDGALKAVRLEFNRLAQAIGNELLPYVKQFAAAAADFVRDVLPVWIERAKETVSWLREHPAILYAVAGAIVGALVPAVYAAVASFVAAAIALAPFIIGGAIIGGLVAGILWLVNNWHLVAAVAREVWGGIADFLKGILNYIVGVFVTFWAFLDPNWREHLAGLGTFFRTTWEGITGALQRAVEFILNLLDRLWSAVQNIVGKVTGPLQKVGGFLGNILGSAKSAVSTISGAISTAISVGASVTGIQDAIITPSGQIIRTDPADFLIATKTPGALAGSGGGITINIQGGTFYSDRQSVTEFANRLARIINQQLKLKNFS